MRVKFVAQASTACVLAAAAIALGSSHMRPAAFMRQAATPNVQQSFTLPKASIGSKVPVLGVNLYTLHNYSTAQTEMDGTRTLSYIKNTLHADAVDIVWNVYAPARNANTTVTNNTTLSAMNVGILTKLAQQKYHLLVEYRPMLFVFNKHNPWSGLFKPANPTKWFNSYYAVNSPYLKMAQRYRISEYIMGTEMDLVSPDTPQWKSLLAKSAKIFNGEISYTQHQKIYFPPLTQLPPTKLTGVDMYEPLALPASASLKRVVAAYEAYFAKVPAALLHRTAIQETGIEARAGAYEYPPDLRAPGQLDPVIQYNWFTAGCAAVKRFHMRGIFFWKVDLSDYPITHPAKSLSTFEGRIGAIAIAKCASILHG